MKWAHTHRLNARHACAMDLLFLIRTIMLDLCEAHNDRSSAQRRTLYYYYICRIEVKEPPNEIQDRVNVKLQIANG